MGNNILESNKISYRRLFPWCHLFRAFGIAIDIRKIFLAAMALVILTGGDWLLSYFPISNNQAANQQPVWPSQTRFDYADSGNSSSGALQMTSEFLVNPLEFLMRVSSNWSLVLTPAQKLIDPVILLFRVDQNKTWTEIAYAWSKILWSLSVWAIFGGTITRMAAVQFARDDRVSIGAALKFSGERFLSYVYAPLLPIAGIGILWLMCFIGGLIGQTPAVGDLIVGIPFIVPLVFGLLMALLLIGTSVGWPLMYATISTEGSDGFDGLSRSYSYIFDRPWYYLWLAGLTMLYGSVVIFFVWLVTSLFVYLAGWSLASGMGVPTVDALLQATPPLLGGNNLLVDMENPSLPNGAIAVSWWLELVATLLVGFVYSYFWTSATIIYFLLRKSDDKTDLDEVFYPVEDEQDELLPILGVAGTAEGTAELPDSMIGTAADDSNR